MKKLILFILILLTLQASCTVKLEPVEPLITNEANGIIIKVGEQKETFFKDDLYTPVYINIINNTDKKIKLTHNFFMMADDSNNQFTSVPLSKIVNKFEKRKDRNACPPNCYNRTSRVGSPMFNGGYANTLYAGGYNSPFYPSFSGLYPYFSKDPYLYYKDTDGNYKQVPPTFNYPINQTMPEPYEENPELRGLRMEEIFPGYQVQGLIYFNQATRLAKEKVRLIVNIPDITKEKEPFVFEFFVK